VLGNLISNAIKFTKRGEISVAAELNGQSGATATIRFTVTDTGIGIPPDKMSEIFSPFTQADVSMTRRYGGSGLGLTICKEFVELMGGSIGVSSVEGQGSTFWFTAILDLAPAGQRPDAAESRMGRSIAPGGISRLGLEPHVLVVEDSRTNRQVAVAQLTKLGCRASVVANGAEAIEAVRQTRYDLDLMDCEMPVMDGFAATRGIRESVHSRIPIVALTAHAMPELRDRCLNAGMNDYLTKPLELGRLADVLGKWLAGTGSGEAAQSAGDTAG